MFGAASILSEGGYILDYCCTLHLILLCKIKQIVKFLTLSWSGTIMAVVDSACLSILEATTYMVRMENLDKVVQRENQRV
mmetsp:Transcript_5541/g.10145  ORF Transcript_5541/g.10145 Transcript_5541/m.10145 type:complete len:80 (-) Transcript_5541:3-242(-)